MAVRYIVSKAEEGFSYLIGGVQWNGK